VERRRDPGRRGRAFVPVALGPQVPVRPRQNQRNGDSEDQRKRQKHIKLDPQSFDLALELADLDAVDIGAASRSPDSGYLGAVATGPQTRGTGLWAVFSSHVQLGAL
jgi:hypothetical protein